MLKPSSSKNKDESRVHDKKNACFYYTKELKVGRHLQQVHNDCPEAEKALSYLSHSKERKRELDRIRLLGNYVNNNKVLEQGKGELKVVCRHPASVKGNLLTYLPCMYCYGFFHKGELYRHVHTCEFVNEHDKLHPRQMRYNGSLLRPPKNFTGLQSILGEARTTANEARQCQPSGQERRRDFNLR